MRIIFTPLLLALCLTANAQDGSVDVFNYGTAGMSVINSSPLPVRNEQQRIFILSSPANYILHSYTGNNGGAGDFGLARYDDFGSLDNTFGTGGFVINNFGNDDHAYGMTVNTSGQILQVGTTLNTTTSIGSFAVARYNSAGGLDNTFDGDGRVVTTIAGSNDAVATSVVQNGTVIYVGGFRQNSSTGNIDFVLARYQASNGALLGTTITSIGTEAKINAIALQADGKIVAAGSTNTASVYQFALVRYNSDGSLDNSFGVGGIVTTPILANNNDVAYDVAVQSNGNIVAVGGAWNGSDQDFAVARFTSGGTLDNTFDADGIKTIPVGSADDVAYSVVIQSDGKVLVAGTTEGSTNDFAITRLTATGAVDFANFGETSPGFTIVDFSGTSIDNGYDIAINPGYIMFGGYSDNSLATVRLANSAVVLPVHLTNFTASKLSRSIVLNWQTVNERNASSFEIERSTDGNRFTKIGSVNASGNSDYTKNYSFEDQQPAAINFYRLRIINTNNSIEYSKMVVVRFESSVTLQAFPNPVSNSLNVQITQPKGTIRLDIFDMSGRTVKTYQLTSEGSTISTSVDVSSLVKGVYLLRANDQVIKFIKN